MTINASQATIGLLIPAVEGGLLCHQEMRREAARRGSICPEVVSLALPSTTRFFQSYYKAL